MLRKVKRNFEPLKKVKKVMPPSVSEKHKRKVIDRITCNLYPSLGEMCDLLGFNKALMSRKLTENRIPNNTQFDYYKEIEMVDDDVYVNARGESFKFIKFIKINFVSFAIAEITETGEKHLLDRDTVLKYRMS